jgi:hypothetical protein
MDTDLVRAHAKTRQAATHAAVRGLWALAWLQIITPVRMWMNVLIIMVDVHTHASIHSGRLFAFVLQVSHWALTGRPVMVR